MNHANPCSCGCCEGIQVVTPLALASRPGLPALPYRIGTHSTFLESMLATLSANQPGQPNPLARLTTRDSGDFSIALLDAWAVAGDILTFYQERIANEGYLGAATERASVLELAKLIGYRLRPGVAASGYLAFILQKDAVSVIPSGTAARSVPAPGESPQTFETSQTIDARAVWNQLAPRPTRPQDILLGNVMSLPEVWFAGASTKLKPNDLLLFDFVSQQRVRRVHSIEEDHPNSRTRVLLEEEAFTAAAYARRVSAAILGIPSVPDSLPEKQAVLDALQPLQTLAANLSIAKIDDAVDAAMTALSNLQIADIPSVLDAAAAQLNDLTAANKKHGGILAATVTPLAAPYLSDARTIATAYKNIQDAFSGTLLIADLQDTLATQLASITDAEATSLQLDLWTSFKTGVNSALAAQLRALPVNLKTVQSALQTLKAGGKTGADDALGKISPVIASFDAGNIPQALQRWDAGQDDLNSLISDPATDAGVVTDVANARRFFSSLVDAVKTPATDAQFAKLGTTSKEFDKLVFGPGATLAIAGTIKDFAAFVQPFSGKLATSLTDALTREAASAQPEIQKLVTDFLGALPPVGTGTSSIAKLVKAIQDAEKPLHPAPGDLPALATALDTVITALDPTQIETGLPSPGDLKALSDGIAVTLQQLQNAAVGTETQPGFRRTLASDVATTFSNYAGLLPAPFPPALDLLAELKTIWGLGGDPTVRLISTSALALDKAIQDIKDKSPAILTKTNSLEQRSQIGNWLTGLSNELDALRSTLRAEADILQPQTIDLANLPSILSSGTTASPVAATTGQNLGTAFTPDSDAVLRTLIALKPEFGTTLYAGLRNLRAPAQAPGVYAMRVKANLFGFNAPQRTRLERTGGTPEITINVPIGDYPVIERLNIDGAWITHEAPDTIYLDSGYDQVAVNSWVIVDAPKVAQTAPDATGAAGPGARTFTLSVGGRSLYKASSVATAGRAQYGISGKSTHIVLRNPDGSAAKWLNTDAADLKSYADLPAGNTSLSATFSAASSQVVRQTVAYVQSEALVLAEAPIADPIGSCSSTSAPQEIELDGVYDGLEAGRWLIVTGQRTDAPVPSQEVGLIAGIRHVLTPTLPGDSAHTIVTLTAPLQRCYARASVAVYGNVAPADHGETQTQVLGSGDGGAASQSFTLSRSPLTYLTADTPSGIVSTLKVRANNVLWHEVDTTCGHGPTERIYSTSQDDSGATTLTFGDGIEGSRLPSGSENIRAVYRVGIGKGGNLKAGQLSVLSAPPLGVTSVVNPLPTSGGADPETRDQARRNAPLAVLALDRLVALRDYADFARTFAGISKAIAQRDHDSITVTVAGVDDIPILPGSALLTNLGKALRDFGDPQQPVTVDTRELLLLAISANVALDPDYAWEFVQPQVRAAVLQAFSFDERDLGQPVLLSEVLAAIQSVPGVTYSEVTVLDGVPETLDLSELAKTIAQFTVNSPIRVKANQIAYLSEAVTESLILNQIPGA